MGLYTPTILGGNSYLSWFYDKGATRKGLSQAINRGPIRKFLQKYTNVYVTIQSHDLSAGAQTQYVTAYGVKDGLVGDRIGRCEPGRRVEGTRGDGLDDWRLAVDNMKVSIPCCYCLACHFYRPQGVSGKI